jgi:hypothetical protein
MWSLPYNANIELPSLSGDASSLERVTIRRASFLAEETYSSASRFQQWQEIEPQKRLSLDEVNAKFFFFFFSFFFVFSIISFLTRHELLSFMIFLHKDFP